MTNIFENAKFGDKFLTKDGRCAVLVNWGQFKDKVYLYVKERDIEFYGEEEYNLDGIVVKGSCSHDIIDKWKEPIDEEKLHRYAEEYYTNHGDLPPYANTSTVWQEIKNAFNDGYRKAKEE